MIDYTIDYMPFDFETSISHNVVQNLAIENNEVDQYLQGLADKLTPHMGLNEDMKITLHYVNDSTVNAVTTLGGHIIVYRGLLEKMPDENTLMMVIGHEIAHVKLRHPMKALSKGVIIKLLLTLVFGESSNTAGNFMEDTRKLMMLSFSRDQETLADEEGLKGLNALYGHVQGATALYEIFKQQKDQQSINLPQFLNSHPDLDNRIQHLSALAVSRSWYQTGVLSAIPAPVLTKIEKDEADQNHPQ